MKAVQFARHGDPAEVVEVVDVDLPGPERAEVAIRMRATPINPSDLLTISGEYGALPPLPAIPGNEGLGEIAALGEDVEGWAVGDRVFLPIGGGTWRERLNAPAKGLVAAPPGDLLQLAMLSVNPPTAYLMLHDIVELAAGDWVIQNAANSGVGAYLIELARQAGIKSVNVVRRESLFAPLRRRGADAVVLDGADLGARVKQATGGARIRLAIDAVGGDATMRLADCLSTGGTVVNYGLLSGEPCRISSGHTVFKDICLRGVWLARWLGRAPAEERRALYTKLGAMVVEGALSAEVEASYPIAEASAAVAHAMRGGRDGKILFVAGDAG